MSSDSITNPDEVYVRRANDGDAAAFNKLVERHFGTAYAIAYSRLRMRESAEDLAQEVFVRAFLALKELRQPKQFAAWICRITRNLAFTWMRDSRRRSQLLPQIPLESVAETLVAPIAGSDPRHAAEERQQSDVLREAILGLPEDLREVVLLHYAEELTKAEIAERLGLHAATVTRRLERAVAGLRIAMEPAIRESAKSLKGSARASGRAVALVIAVAALPHAAKASLLTGASAAATTSAPFSLKTLISYASGIKVAGVSGAAVIVIAAGALAFLKSADPPVNPAPRPAARRMAQVSATMSPPPAAFSAQRTSSPATSGEPAVAKTASPLTMPNLAWQSDTYFPPTTDFFPDSVEGGRKLDELFKAVDRDRRSDEEILTTVRNGFKRCEAKKDYVIRWVGNRYIWGKQSNAQAMEILYHALPITPHYSVYFGLSVVDNKTTNVLRTMAGVCVTGDWQEIQRVFWGVQPPQQMVPFIEPYLSDPDVEKREIAGMLIKHLKGEASYPEWWQDQMRTKIRTRFGHRMPELKDQLSSTSSEARLAALREIRINGLMELLDDSFLQPLEKCTGDPDPEVRRQVARLVGGKWIWKGGEQNPKAIEIALTLAADREPAVVNDAVYFGLSTVRVKPQAVVDLLVQLALNDHEPNNYSRITWSFRNGQDAQQVEQALLAQLKDAQTDQSRAAIALFYRDLYEKDAPSEWKVSDALSRYPSDLFVAQITANPDKSGLQTADALWDEFARSLPADSGVKRQDIFGNNVKGETDFAGKPVSVFALMRGTADKDAVAELAKHAETVRVGEISPVSIAMQLYLEEREVYDADRFTTAPK